MITKDDLRDRALARIPRREYRIVHTAPKRFCVESRGLGWWSKYLLGWRELRTPLGSYMTRPIFLTRDEALAWLGQVQATRVINMMTRLQHEDHQEEIVYTERWP